MRAGALGENGRDRLPRLRPAGVHDPAVRVPALAPEVVVEADAELDQIGDPCRRLLGQRPDRSRAAEASAGAQGVGGMKTGCVALTERRRHAALRVPAVRARHGSLREQEDVGILGCRKGSDEAGDTAADDEQVKPFTLALGGHS